MPQTGREGRLGHTKGSGLFRKGVGLGGGVHGVDIILAVVETVKVIQRNMHCEKAIRAVKLDGTRAAVFKFCLSPRLEYITRSQYCLWRKDGLDDIGTVKAELPVDQTVGARERSVPTFCTAEVLGDVCTIDSNQNGHRGNIDSSDHQQEVSSDADVHAPVHQGGGPAAYSNRQPAVIAKAKDTWAGSNAQYRTKICRGRGCSIMKVGLYPGKVVGKLRDSGLGISVGWSGQDGDERTWWCVEVIGACWWIRIDRRWFSWWTIDEGCGVRDCLDRRGLWWV
jgi:hypothetical protein